MSVPGVEHGLTPSLGIATIPLYAGAGDKLARSADRALYLAKTNGRNRTEITIATSQHESEHAPVSA